MKLLTLLTAAMLSISISDQASAQQQCPVKLGVVLELTGPLAPVAKRIVDSANLALEHVNQGGGIKGCPAELIFRDSQGQPNVGVDAAKFLVDVDRVAALTGGLASGVALPVLTSVAVPSNIPFVACCATAATFTQLSQEGKTKGMFFHLMATVKTQAYSAARAMADKGYKNVAVIYINGDFGNGLVKYFPAAFEKFGGKVTSMVPYNENQTSYRAEVNKAMADKPDAIYLAAFPQDGATIAREWLSLGGTQNFMFHNALRNKEFIEAVGSRFLQSAIGYDNASVEGPTVDAFRNAFKAKYNYDPVGAGILPQYDAIMVLALAMNIAPDMSGPSIRDSVRKIQEPNGATVGTGPDEFRKALVLIKDKRPIKYVGATGAVEFDPNGDVAGPMLFWSVKGSDLQVDRTMSIDDINQIMKVVDR